MCEGVEGEPLAASLLAADRPILSRSFRFHRPRGLMCSTGQCGWCECEVDGRPSVRSCREPVRAGLVARGEHALPSVERDLLSLVGLASQWIPPTFYHHRFLRPRILRKRYLDVLRWLGGRGRLGTRTAARPPARTTRRIESDVLVVGGGPAGWLVALGAAEAGARVVLCEAEREPGSGWRVEPGTERGPGSVAGLTRQAAVDGVEVLVGVAAIGWYDGMIVALGDEARYEIRAGAIVSAMGAYDRVPLVPGADRPGVMAARTVAGLVERHGILPGERVLLVGDDRELAAAREQLGRAGVATLIGPIPTVSLVSVRGRRRVTGAVIRDGKGERRVSVDLVVFADRSPNLDLVLAAGAAVEAKRDTIVPVCDESGRTSVATLFVAGSAAGRPVVGTLDGEVARLVGRAAAATAAAGPTESSLPLAPPARPALARPSTATATAAGAIVCFCEDVRAWEIRAERAAGYDDPELIKRRTGALTGPCQGKYCLQAFACIAGSRSDGAVALPTARPPLRPVRLGDLVGTEEPRVSSDATR